MKADMSQKENLSLVIRSQRGWFDLRLGELWNARERIKGCDVVVLMVAHSEYRKLDLGKLKSVLLLPVLIDGRHVFNEDQARAVGLTYRCIGADSVTV